MTPEQEVANTRAAQLAYAEVGITTAQEGATHLSILQTLKRASDADANIIDVIAFPFVTDLDKILAEFPRSTWLSYNKGMKIGGVKISIDGSPQGKTAAFTTPYLVPGPSGEANWKGEMFVSQEIINGALKKVYALDVPVLFHVNGDAAIDALLAYHLPRLHSWLRVRIGGGLGPVAGKVWRIGTMGHTARQRNVTTLLAALSEILD